MEHNCSENREFTFDIKDMFAEFIRYFHLILICMVIFAVALPGLKYVRASMDMEQSTSVNIESSRDALSEAENKAIDAYLELYYQMEEMNRNWENSIMMNLNSGQVYTTSLIYSFESATNITSDDIAAIYDNYISYGKMISDMYPESSAAERMHAQEMIIATATPESGCMSIWVYGKDEDSAKEVTTLLKNALEEYSKTVSDMGYEHTYQVLNENTAIFVDTSLYQTQQYRATMLSTLNKTADAEYEALSEAQKSIVLRELAQDEATENGETLTGGVQVNKIFVVLGALAGAVFACLIIFVKYLFGSSIKSATENERMFHLPVIFEAGKYRLKGFSKLADKLVYKTPSLTEAEERQLLVTKIKKLCSNLNVEKLLFTGMNQDVLEKEFSQVVEALKEKNINCEIIGNLSYDADAVAELDKENKIILVKQIKKSKYAGMIEQLKVCNELKVSVLGTILLH